MINVWWFGDPWRNPALKFSYEVRIGWILLTVWMYWRNGCCQYTFIRQTFQNIDWWISNLKKIFLKASCGVEIFNEIALGLSLSPKSVLTLRGMWLSAVILNENSNSLKILIGHLDEDVILINFYKSISSSINFKNDLGFISGNYGFLPHFLKNYKIKMFHLLNR